VAVVKCNKHYIRLITENEIKDGNAVALSVPCRTRTLLEAQII